MFSNRNFIIKPELILSEHIIPYLYILAFLSRGYADGGRVEVSVFGGYQDARGDAAKN